MWRHCRDGEAHHRRRHTSRCVIPIPSSFPRSDSLLRAFLHRSVPRSRHNKARSPNTAHFALRGHLVDARRTSHSAVSGTALFVLRWNRGSLFRRHHGRLASAALSRERVVVWSCAADLVLRTPTSSSARARPSRPPRLMQTDATKPLCLLYCPSPRLSTRAQHEGGGERAPSRERVAVRSHAVGLIVRALNLVVDPRARAAVPRADRRHHASVPAASPIAAFVHSSPTRRRRRVRAEPRTSRCSIGRRRPRQARANRVVATRARRARRAAVCRVASSRLCDCCIAHRRVCSSEFNHNDDSERARRAASESLFDRASATSLSVRRSRRRPARGSRCVSCRSPSPRLTACCIARRRACSLEPNTMTAASPRRGAHEPSFDRESVSPSTQRSCWRSRRAGSAAAWQPASSPVALLLLSSLRLFDLSS